MEEEKRKLVIDGNAFYEIDLECIKRRKKREETEKIQKQRQRR